MLKRTVFGITLAVLLTSVLMLAFCIQPVEASGTIYIRADGSIDPPTAPISTIDKITYTLKSNTSDSIVVERDNIVIDGSGYTVQGTGAPSSKAIDLIGRSNVTIKNMSIKAFCWGIYLSSSSSNSLSCNKVANNNYGISLYHSSNNNSLSGNDITVNTQFGIYIHSSCNNIICCNNITNNSWGISLSPSSSNNNIVSNNNITNNGWGIYLYYSSNNSIYHNNFVNNTHQIGSFGSYGNAVDNGYPSGGNYWSNHNPPDIFSGPDQNIIGSDKIGDIPYVIDENNTDRYPLIYPYGFVSSPDLNGDGKIGMHDVVTMAKTLGSFPGHNRWKPYCDLNVDGKIDVRDTTIVCKNFGK